MADSKRPQRPVYNYNNETSKSERGRPQRVSYGSAQRAGQEARPQPSRKARVQYNQPPGSTSLAQAAPQQASPFYDVAADAPAPKSGRAVLPQDDGYTELVFPPRTVITATREIPQRDVASERAELARTASRPPVALPRQDARGAVGKGATEGLPRQSGRAPAAGASVSGGKDRRRQTKQKSRGLLGALLRKKNQQPAKPKAKRHVVLADARTQRRRRNLLAVLGIVAAIITGAVLSLTVLFKIETIVVEGETPYTAAEIILAFGRKQGDNLLAFHAKTLAQEMQKKLPYLEDIKIHRVLPSKVKIEVTQAVEAYSVSSVSGWVVLSDTLRVLRIDPQPPAGLPGITGTEAVQPVLGETLVLEDAEKLAALRALKKELDTQQLLPVTEINLSDTLNMSFIYAGRIRVVIGTPNDLVNKIDWAKYLITPSGEESLPETEHGTLDVSNRNEEGRFEGIWRAGVL